MGWEKFAKPPFPIPLVHVTIFHLSCKYSLRGAIWDMEYNMEDMEEYT